MWGILKYCDQKTLSMIREVGREADAKKLNAFVVGGFVRDIILKRPNKDIDIVIQGDAVVFARQFSEKKKLAMEAHERFGTAVIHDWHGWHVDFVSARSEDYPQPGTLPITKRSHIIDDLFRRDFTINAMAVSISKDTFGEVHIPGKAFSDLKCGIIRVFHDQSFIDDPTRILRAIRFEQRFGFRLAARTRRLLNEAIVNHAERTVSAPRYFQEFARGLMEERPVKYIRRLKRLGALEFLGLFEMPKLSAFNRLDGLMHAWKGGTVDQKACYLMVLFGLKGHEKVGEYADRFQWRREDRKKILQGISSLEGFNLLKNSRLQFKEMENFIQGLPVETIFFIRAVSSGKIVTSCLDKELRRRN